MYVGVAFEEAAASFLENKTQVEGLVEQGRWKKGRLIKMQGNTTVN